MATYAKGVSKGVSLEVMLEHIEKLLKDAHIMTLTDHKGNTEMSYWHDLLKKAKIATLTDDTLTFDGMVELLKKAKIHSVKKGFWR